MVGITLYVLLLSIAFAVTLCVSVERYARVKKENEKLRAEIEHSERDEALLEEARRFTLVTVAKAIELNVQQYECLKEHNLL